MIRERVLPVAEENDVIVAIPISAMQGVDDACRTICLGTLAKTLFLLGQTAPRFLQAAGTRCMPWGDPRACESW